MRIAAALVLAALSAVTAHAPVTPAASTPTGSLGTPRGWDTVARLAAEDHRQR
jgi:hypothetical protein